MSLWTNFTVVLIKNGWEWGVGAPVTNVPGSAWSASWDVHVAESSLRARQALIRHLGDLKIFYVESRTAEQLPLSARAADILSTTRDHLARSQGTIVIWLANLRQELGLIIAEVTTWAQTGDGCVAGAHLTGRALNRLGRSFLTVIAKRAIKTVVLKDSTFIVDVRSRATGSRLD
jgi:hypothetical protein